MHLSFHHWDQSTQAQRSAATLGSTDVQVWIAQLPADGGMLPALAGTLRPDEIDRANRISWPAARHHFIWGRAILRQLLGVCLNVEPITVSIGYAPRGKPYLLPAHAGGDLRFNLSHSHSPVRSLVAIAVARGRDLGVDIEWISHALDWSAMANRIFSGSELKALRALARPLQRQAFFNGWTRKEAYLKATGDGLSDPLSAIEVSLAPNQNPERLHMPSRTRPAHRWDMQFIPLPPEYAGTVAIQALRGESRRLL